MRVNKAVLVSICLLFFAPVITFSYVALQLTIGFESVAQMEKGERPGALAQSIDRVALVHYYGIAVFYLGLILMIVTAFRGYKKDSRIMWVFAVSTGAFVCAKANFIIGIITLLALFRWKSFFRTSMDSSTQNGNVEL